MQGDYYMHVVGGLDGVLSFLTTHEGHRTIQLIDTAQKKVINLIFKPEAPRTHPLPKIEASAPKTTA